VGKNTEVHDMDREQEKLATDEEINGIPTLLTAQEIGEKLRISSKTVHKLVRAGRLGCVKITARERRFTMDLLEEFIRAETYHRDWIHDDSRNYSEAMGDCRP
jgi:excisionase family DNA binding protein